MKRIPAFFPGAVLVALWASPALAQTCEQAPSGLVSWWSGDGDASDIAGGNNGTLQNGPTFVAGKVGQAFSFDGVNDYVDIGDRLDMQTGDFTLEAWVKGDPTMQLWGRILDKGFLTGYAFGRAGSSNRVGFEFLGSGSQGNSFSTTSNVIDNSWHHVAVVKSQNTATIYADGVAENSETVSMNSQDNTLPLWIGYNPNQGTRGYWKGQIDELAIFGRALSPCEIRTIYDAGSAGKCKGDSDGDGVSDLIDNCLGVSNPVQEDFDTDGAGDACDCAPGNSSVFRIPREIKRFEFGSDATTLTWCSAVPSTGTSTLHDITRGALGQFPVGTGASELCLGSGVSASMTTDPLMPGAGGGFWYLVRGRNGCGAGTYGFASSNVERLTSICP